MGKNNKTEKPKKVNGGKRPNSGRKKKEITFQELGFGEKRKLFSALVSQENFIEIVKLYIQSAKTNPANAEYLINQLIGKAPQAVHLSGPNGEPLFSQADKAKTKTILDNLLK